MISLTRIFYFWLFGLNVLSIYAEQSTSSQGQSQAMGIPAPPVSVVTDPAYKLSVGDQISVSVYEEPSLRSDQLIDRDGVARLFWIGDTKLTGLTVREAEHAIEAIYRERKLLKKPVVTLVVTAFQPREAMVFGAGIGNPGPVPFPRDATTMDIVEAITRAGNLKPGARSKSVTVRHKESDGTETVSTVDVDAMISTKRGEQKRGGFPIYPGDLIRVEMSIF